MLNLAASSGGMSDCGSENEDEDELAGLDDSKSELELPGTLGGSLTELQMGDSGSPESTEKSEGGGNTRPGSCSPLKNMDENDGKNSGGTGSKRRGQFIVKFRVSPQGAI